MVARGGVEPPTYRFSGGRSYQLSYLAKPATNLTTPQPQCWFPTNTTTLVRRS